MLANIRAELEEQLQAVRGACALRAGNGYLDHRSCSEIEEAGMTDHTLWEIIGAILLVPAGFIALAGFLFIKQWKKEHPDWRKEIL
ncbi:MAG TPA: hypothetical protein VGS10_19455 [Terracidiphilus sp.]|nr:hypothetical protein [Terracidiphilus sp.]